MPVSTIPDRRMRRSRELAGVSWTEARGGGVARVTASRMRRTTPAEAKAKVGIATAAKATMVRVSSIVSPTSQVAPQKSPTTSAAATADWPRQRASSATRTRRGSPASADSGLRGPSFR